MHDIAQFFFILRKEIKELNELFVSACYIKILFALQLNAL